MITVSTCRCKALLMPCTTASQACWAFRLPLNESITTMILGVGDDVVEVFFADIILSFFFIFYISVLSFVKNL